MRYIDPDGRSADDIIVDGQTWTPGAVWDGEESDFGFEVFAALNSLHKTIEAGDVSTPERTGNVILDFVGNTSKNVTIISGQQAPFGGGTQATEDGTQIFWNPGTDIMVGPSEDGRNIPGLVSAETSLAHEFGHAWLAQFSPNLNAGFERADARNSDNGGDPDRNEHNAWILPQVEHKFSRARGEGGIRTIYRPIFANESIYLSETGSTGYGDYFIFR